MPRKIGDLTSLEALNFGNNSVFIIPKEIDQLKMMQKGRLQYFNNPIFLV